MATPERPTALSLVQLTDRLLERHGDTLHITVGIVEQRAKLDTADTVKVAGMLLDVTELIPHMILHDILREMEKKIITRPSTGEMRAAQLKALLDRRVSELELSVRTDQCFQLAKIRYVGEIVQKAEIDLLRIKNFGRRSLKEVKGLLAEMDLSIGMDVGDWKPPTTQDTP